MHRHVCEGQSVRRPLSAASVPLLSTQFSPSLLSPLSPPLHACMQDRARYFVQARKDHLVNTAKRLMKSESDAAMMMDFQEEEEEDEEEGQGEEEEEWGKG
jgi:hypothetical protein